MNDKLFVKLNIMEEGFYPLSIGTFYLRKEGVQITAINSTNTPYYITLSNPEHPLAAKLIETKQEQKFNESKDFFRFILLVLMEYANIEGDTDEILKNAITIP